MKVKYPTLLIGIAKEPYWYEYFHSECPVCGSGGYSRERRYTAKPVEYEKRHHYDTSLCGGHY